MTLRPPQTPPDGFARSQRPSTRLYRRKSAAGILVALSEAEDRHRAVQVRGWSGRVGIGVAVARGDRGSRRGRVGDVLLK